MKSSRKQKNFIKDTKRQFNKNKHGKQVLKKADLKDEVKPE